MTWQNLSEFAAMLTPEQRAAKIVLKPDPVAEVLKLLPQKMFLSCAVPPTPGMGGPYLFVATEE